MKKILLYWLFSLILIVGMVQHSRARINVMVIGGQAGGVAECTAQGNTDNDEGTTDDYLIEDPYYAFGSAITVGETSCKINKWYYATTGGHNGSKIKMRIYADSGGHPTGSGAFAACSEITLGASRQWQSAACPEITLEANTTYYLIVIEDGNIDYIATPTGTNMQYMTFTVGNYDTFPTWSGTSEIERVHSCYVIWE